jgi:hypothetical protein
VLLVEAYEDLHYPIPDAPAGDVISYLLEQRGENQKDLVPEVFTSGSRASDITSGKQQPSKEVALKLAKYFKLPVGAFPRTLSLAVSGRDPSPVHLSDLFLSRCILNILRFHATNLCR